MITYSCVYCKEQFTTKEDFDFHFKDCKLSKQPLPKSDDIHWAVKPDKK